VSGLIFKDNFFHTKLMKSYNSGNNKDPLWKSKAKMRLTYKNDVMIISGLGNRELAEGNKIKINNFRGG
jgi:hypothetical protein